MSISFGSDGFRGRIGHQVNRETIARIVLASFDTVRSQDPEQPAPTIPIGYDTRFLSREFAQFAARLLLKEGARPSLAERPCPSPYLAFAVKQLSAPMGLQFTASHNPPAYGGVKLKGPQGGSLVPSQVELVEFYAEHCNPERYSAEPLIGKATAASFNLDQEYSDAIAEAVQWDGNPSQPILVDYLHGAGSGIYRELLARYAKVAFEFNTEPDPLFGGIKPEPVPARLNALVAAVKGSGPDAVGIAFDGDGDRLAVVDEAGQVLASHEIFCLLMEFAAKRLQPNGGIAVTSVSFSCLVERVAHKLGLVVNEVPVGFKNVTQAMIESNALIGGEESGGTGFSFHLPERDALLMALLLLAARQASGTALHQMVEDLYERHGRPVFFSANVPLPARLERTELKARLRTLVDLTELAGDEVVGLNHKDGMKLKTAQGWVLLRPSGTEPLLRVYAEADSMEDARSYAFAALSHTGLPALPK